MSDPKPTTVDEYIEQAPEQAREKLRELRALLREVVPEATEALKWGNPVFEEKRILFAYAAYKSHMNFMPTASSMRPFLDELAALTIGKDTIQLPYDQPIPGDLIARIAAHRARDVRENDARWM